MRRHLRDEGEPALTIDREIARFLTAVRKPIAIEV
jgi:hypothetical protein